MADENKDIALDPEAQRLFEEFGGLQAHKKFSVPGVDLLAQSLLSEQKRHDAVRILMIKTAWLISRYLKDKSFSAEIDHESKVFSQLSKVLGKLAGLPGHLGPHLLALLRLGHQGVEVVRRLGEGTQQQPVLCRQRAFDVRGG